MAFSDPQSVTINGVASSLPRTSSGTNAGSFTTNDGTLSLQVSNAYGKRIRRTVSLQSKKYATDPTNNSLSVPVFANFRVSVDQPLQGFTADELKLALVGFLANLTASTNANMIKLLGGEN